MRIGIGNRKSNGMVYRLGVPGGRILTVEWASALLDPAQGRRQDVVIVQQTAPVELLLYCSDLPGTFFWRVAASTAGGRSSGTGPWVSPAPLHPV